MLTHDLSLLPPVGLAVPPIDPDATFHLNQAAGLQMGEIGPPTPGGMEAVFPPALGLPEHQEAIFEAGGGLDGTVTQAGHGLPGESKNEAGQVSTN
jgi:hypothetical protein